MRMSFSPAAPLNRQSATQVVTRTVLADGDYVYVCARALDPRGFGGMVAIPVAVVAEAICRPGDDQASAHGAGDECVATAVSCSS
jgi:hypothetical protein